MLNGSQPTEPRAAASPRPERERALLVGATPLLISAGGLPQAAWSWGPADAPTVALVHGWAGRGAQLVVAAANLVLDEATRLERELARPDLRWLAWLR